MINQAAAPVAAPAVTTASTVVAAQPAPVSGGKGAIELPKTGPEDLVMGSVGMGSVIAAGFAYANSRKELLGAFLNR